MNVEMLQLMVRDLGWTLVHFVWEGLVIAALLAAALRMLKNSAAQTRYLASCAALALMALAPVVTLLLVAQANRPLFLSTRLSGSVWTETASRAASLPPLVVSGPSKPPAMNFARQLEMLFPWLVLGWMAGVCALSCRLFAGWLRVRRLRVNSASPLAWTEPIANIARRLGVSRPVRLLQSVLVEVPTVIGWLRPVILLPASCMTGLTPRQLESIIAHELAHIRRHDYLVNLLQSAVETLLFYHPAVWRVSRRIREERELCCDDLAVAVCGDRAGYARALATLEELRPSSAQLALAAGGAPLLQSIRRLAGKPERSAGRASWPVAGIALLLVLGILCAGMREHRAAAQTVNPPDAGTNPSTLPGPIRTVSVVPVASATNSAVSNSTPEVNIKASFVEITSTPGDTNTILGLDTPGNPRSAVAFTGLLTEPQFKATINALEQRNGTDILAMPGAVTLSGRRVKIQVGDAMTLLLPGHGTNAYEMTNMLFGQTLDATATVSPDKKMISVTLTPTITEFKGYMKPTNGPVKGPRGQLSVMLMPVIDTRTTTANATVWDGSTVVIGGLIADRTQPVVHQVPLLGSLPVVGRVFHSVRAEQVKKEILVFVTVTLIKPDGTLYHSDEERNALLAGPPPAQGSTNQ